MPATKTTVRVDWIARAPSLAARQARGGVCAAAAAGAGLSHEQTRELIPTALAKLQTVTVADQRYLRGLAMTRLIAHQVRSMSGAGNGLFHRADREATAAAHEVADTIAEPGTPLHRLISFLALSPPGDAIDQEQ